jgi:transcriptional regulator GlxA family with amidase domain
MFVHLVIDGAADGPLGVAVEILHAASQLKSAGSGEMAHRPRALRQRVVSVSGDEVRTSAGRRCSVDGAFKPAALRRGDVVLLPGFGAATEDRLALLLARPDVQKLLPQLPRLVERGVLVAASCSATFVLAASGILAGQRATTSWWLAPAFARRFPAVRLEQDKLIVESAGRFTAGAALAHADLVLAVLARHHSPALAHLVSRYLVLDERVSQSRYQILERLRGDDPTVRRLEAFLLRHLGRQVSLDEMARATATSTRTLARRVRTTLGISPRGFAQRLRVARADHLLATTTESVEAIAARVGYADAAAFRRIFRRETGQAPRERRLRIGNHSELSREHQRLGRRELASAALADVGRRFPAPEPFVADER